MDRTEFIVAVMILLFGAYLLGFLTHWIVTRLSRVSDAELSQLDTMAENLYRAEEERDAEREARHRTEIQMRTEVGEMRAELSATRDALRSAQEEAEELRTFIAVKNSRQA